MTDATSKSAPHDARGVANLLLFFAAEAGVALTNLSLQKLVYFAHGLMVVRHGRPLVDGYFEAWEYGPVHPLLYASFKSAGRGVLTQRAVKRDLRTGVTQVAAPPEDPESRAVVEDVFRALGRQSSTRLVNLSHAKGGPWHEVVNESGTRAGLGLRISDMVIKQRFHRHLISIGAADEREGVAFDEIPPA
ncbi:type VI toxin-antitoxin system SocA family antitoxin [Caulobacter sp. RL271]|uniref:DUF4065 domain-containing protein n=1 Tax=Caulobacter segnis TaxID=88688 RepID=A0ABY4ZV66_9CAUL|nr:type II toxin-antitoxin system antitoxin SocA domain-containing protein [Caulobacter segnis]USQ96514.1 DUF4065 domain-containing protein [Caulobacter segnis]